MRLSVKGVFLSALLLSTVFTLFDISQIHAQQDPISAKSIGFEDTTILEFTNESQTSIDTIRMWLGDEMSFKSFKTEKGWTGQMTPQGVLVFSTTKPLKPGEIVKFGIKTDKAKPGINWRVVDTNDEDVAIGKTLVSELPSNGPGNDQTTESTQNTNGAIFDTSTFRLVPEKPSVGSSMRVSGQGFGANENLQLYLNTQRLETFKTDDSGNFIITSEIPETQEPGRVDFIVRDSQNNEKSISLRISESTDRMSESLHVPLNIDHTPPVVFRGDEVKVTGTGKPGGTVTATIKNEQGHVLTTIAVEVNGKGQWEYETVISPDAPFGEHTAEITDGTETIVRTWTVESSKTIVIEPEKLKFEPGETIFFNGTAIPNEELEIIVEDPQGTEFYSEVINVDATGEVSFEFPTTQASTEGTYIVFASQNENTEIFLVGLGEFPEVQLIVKADKLNYAAGSKAILDISGPASATLSLLVVDPADKNKFSDTIVLKPDGTAKYELDLTGYGSGVYTVVITRGNSQGSDIFSVGLQTGSGDISVRTTKDTYGKGEAILILGTSGENILLTVSLKDPDGKIVKEKETFTNKDGVFSEDSFRIPLDAKVGTWVVNAKSGPNFDNVEISVVGDLKEGIAVFVDDVKPTPSGKIATIKGYGAAVSQNVIITITNEDGEQVDELTVVSTGIGEFTTLWVVPPGSPPGTYLVHAQDAHNEAQTEMIIK